MEELGHRQTPTGPAMLAFHFPPGASGLRIRVICALRREIAAGISRHVGKDFAESDQPDLFVAAAAG